MSDLPTPWLDCDDRTLPQRVPGATMLDDQLLNLMYGRTRFERLGGTTFYWPDEATRLSVLDAVVEAGERAKGAPWNMLQSRDLLDDVRALHTRHGRPETD